MATKVQLIGGNFQDAEGAVLANGTLTLKLNQDSKVNSSEICAGITVTIQLDSNGNVASSTSTPAASNQFVWGNDQLTPANSFYKVTGYAANGQLVFGANNQQVIGNGGTFDVSTWIPNTVFSWQPPLQVPTLETNGVPNSNQALLNLQQGTNITLTNVAGTTTINATVPTPPPAPTGLCFFGPGIFEVATILGTSQLASGAPSGLVSGVPTANTLVVYKFTLPIAFTISKITTQCLDNLGGSATFGIYSAAGAKLVDGGSFPNLTASIVTNTITPVTLPAGVYWHAQAATTADNAHFPGFVIDGSSIENLNIIPFYLKNSVKIGTAANPLAAGVLPATLGTVTLYTPSNVNGDGVCCPLYE